MEYVRDIIDSRLLDKINLPQALRNRKVEIIILPANEKEKINNEKKSINSVIGVLGKYKNPELIQFEKKAWEEAAEEKYVNN